MSSRVKDSNECGELISKKMLEVCKDMFPRETGEQLKLFSEGTLKEFAELANI